ncbi:MAG: DUF4304 domain-containing protein [Flavobacteriales bacterium]|nr:DUF4304 domain-containing protein [Flavobacteriales bacterium]
MAANEADLVRLLEIHLALHGFKRTKKTWYLESDDCYSLVELDKGTWGGNYHLNLNVVLKAWGAKPSHDNGELLGWGVEVLMPETLRIREALDLSNMTLTSTERDALLIVALEEYAIPFVKRTSTLEGLKEELRRNKRMRYHTSLILWEHLKLDVPRNPKLDE